MGDEQVRIRVWISEDVSERLDAYVAAQGVPVARTVDTALDLFLASMGY